MATRPTSFPLWSTGNPNGCVQPSSAQQSAGYSPSEVPACETFNYMWNNQASWLQYLDERTSATTLTNSLDFSTRLIGGGNWAYLGTTLAWTGTAYLGIPSSPDSANTIAAGSVNLQNGFVAYVTANFPYSTTATTTSGSNQLTQVVYGDVVTAGQTVSGTGIPSGTTVSSVSSDGTTITLSAAAQASASQVTVTFATAGNLTVSTAQSSSFVPGPNTVVIARGLGSTCIVGVGSGQMLLRQGEQKQLLGHGFASSASLVAGSSLSALAPVYISPGSTDQARTSGAAYPLDSSTAGTAIRSLFAGFTSSSVAPGATVEVVQVGKLNGFSGLTPGAVYYASSSQGSLTTVKTSNANEWVVPVGIALSATQMYVLAGRGAVQNAGDLTVYNNLNVAQYASAGSFVSAAGFKSQLAFGTLFSLQGTGTFPFTETVTEQSGGSVVVAQVHRRMGASGSILGINLTYAEGNYGANIPNQFIVLKNNAAVVTTSGTLSGGLYPLAKGVVTFVAGDVLQVQAKITQNQGYNVRCDLLLEFSA